MEVKNNLPARMEVLRKTPLYKGGDLLIDIGCSHAYFEIELTNLYKKIIAITPKEEEYLLAIKYTKHLKNVEIYQSTFKNFDFKEPADMVWMGSCLHYIFMEAYGYSFIDKLLKISKNYLIIEYICDFTIDSEDVKVLKDNLEKLGLDKLYNKENLKYLLSEYFIIENELKSASITREILVLKRK
jgi:hypothetical protein